MSHECVIPDFSDWLIRFIYVSGDVDQEIANTPDCYKFNMVAERWNSIENIMNENTA